MYTFDVYGTGSFKVESTLLECVWCFRKLLQLLSFVESLQFDIKCQKGNGTDLMKKGQRTALQISSVSNCDLFTAKPLKSSQSLDWNFSNLLQTVYGKISSNEIPSCYHWICSCILLHPLKTKQDSKSWDPWPRNRMNESHFAICAQNVHKNETKHITYCHVTNCHVLSRHVLSRHVLSR